MYMDKIINQAYAIYLESLDSNPKLSIKTITLLLLHYSSSKHKCKN